MEKTHRNMGNAAAGTPVVATGRGKPRYRHRGSAILAAGTLAALGGLPGTAQAQLVNLCTGVSLPPSAVTSIISSTVVPVTGTLDTTLNSILGLPLLGLGGTSALQSNLSGLLATAASGAPIGLTVLDTNGSVVGTTNCSVPVVPSTPAGIALGGNQISGLGAVTPASAGEINSIAIGNGATTNAAAPNSVALGPNASVGAAGTGSLALGSAASATAANSVALGAGSVANRGAQVAYAAFGLAAPQTSVGEVSVGSLGSLRIISNVAPGSALTDAVNVEQLQAVDNGAVKYDNPTLKTSVTLGGVGGTTISNLAPGVAGTDAVNVNQLRTIATTPVMYFHANSTGADSLANGAESIAIGPRSLASATNSIAAGNGATASAVNSVALGSGAVADRVNTVSVGAPGSERQITNVQDATAPTDAVNLRQLNAAMANDQRDANAGTAAALAAASLPQAAMPGKSMAVAGLATYQGESALAVGISRLSDNGRWAIRFNGSSTTRGKVGAGVGVGFYF